MAAPASAPTTTPANTSTSKGSRPCTNEAIAVDQSDRGKAHHKSRELDAGDR